MIVNLSMIVNLAQVNTKGNVGHSEQSHGKPPSCTRTHANNIILVAFFLRIQCFIFQLSEVAAAMI